MLILFLLILLLCTIVVNFGLRIETLSRPAACDEPDARFTKEGDLLSIHYTGFFLLNAMLFMLLSLNNENLLLFDFNS